MKRKIVALALLVFAITFAAICQRHQRHPNQSFFQSWESPFQLCEDFCKSKGQDYSDILQDSMGTCICDNEEGRKVQKGYHLYINGGCSNE